MRISQARWHYAIILRARKQRRQGKAKVRGPGRPKGSFDVQLGAGVGQSSPQRGSLRGRVLEFLKSRDGHSASIEQLEHAFGRNMRGVVAKLQQVNWVKVFSSVKS